MKVSWSKSAEHDLERVGDRSVVERIVDKVTLLATTGQGDVRKMKGAPGYRLRVGSWRVRFEYDAGELVVLHIAPRGSAYRD